MVGNRLTTVGVRPDGVVDDVVLGLLVVVVVLDVELVELVELLWLATDVVGSETGGAVTFAWSVAVPHADSRSTPMVAAPFRQVGVTAPGRRVPVSCCAV